MLDQETAEYRSALTRQLWRYRLATFGDRPNVFDPVYESAPSPPVFRAEFADLNVLTPDDPTQADRVRGLIPPNKRHRWFRSMRSSQALAQSVFGNLVVQDRLDCLRQVAADDGAGPAFGKTSISASQVELEHDVQSLGEPRPTSVDVLISSGSVICVECKLSETEVGRCSRPRLKKDHAEYCDGSYRRQGSRSDRCALTARGIAYWNYISSILPWPVDRDHDPCPLAEPYQLVRNVLAATVENREVHTARGHALLVYDARNRAFRPQPDGAFERLQRQLREPDLLRRCSWQAMLTAMADVDDLRWLVRRVGEKYGLVATL